MSACGSVILHLEDNDNDALLFQKALGDLPYICHRVRDGEEGVLYMKGVGIYHDRKAYPLPHLIISDLNMPRMNGFEFLFWMRADPAFAEIPVIIFTDSSQAADFATAAKHGIKSFIQKGTDAHLYNKKIREALAGSV